MEAILIPQKRVQSEACNKLHVTSNTTGIEQITNEKQPQGSH